jgi:hypothetical protein
MSTRAKIWIEFILSAIGFGLLWYGSNWTVAVGFFITLLANNMMFVRFLKDLVEKIK